VEFIEHYPTTMTIKTIFYFFYFSVRLLSSDLEM